MKNHRIGRAAAAVVGALAAFVAAGAAPAQAIVGKDLPALSFATWLRGAPLGPGQTAAPKVVVYACYTTPQTAPQLAWDVAHLARLQAEFGPRGVAVVVVLPNADGVDRVAGDCRVAVAADGAAHAWLGDEAGSLWHVLVVDAAATVTFVGEPGSGLEDAVANTLAGENTTLDERRAQQLRRMTTFEELPARFLREALPHQVHLAPRDGVAAGLLVALAAQAGDPAAARRVFDRCLPGVGASARGLARFADLVLRAGGPDRGVADLLADRLVEAAAGAPDDPVIGLALLRALLAAGRDREFGRHVMRVRKAAATTAGTSLAFVEILTKAAEPAVHRDLAEVALTRAAALGAPPRLLDAARYQVTRSCAGDAAAAAALCEAYCAKVEQGGSLNDDCWDFLTELDTLGRYDGFALAIAERMLQDRARMDHFGFDTAALAMFRAGRAEAALTLQQASLELGGKDEPDYVARLRRYEAAVAAGGPGKR